MAIRNIVTEGDPILRKICRPVDEVTDRTRQQLDDMCETMMQANGVGIAAPQVGLMKRMFACIPNPDVEEDEDLEVVFMINPEFLEREGEQEGYEGCLSVPGYIGKVVRPTHVKVKYIDYFGNEVIRDFDDFGAVVVSHEYDHLDGILYIDKAEDVHLQSEDMAEEE